jgi:hypothetical protein
MSRLSGKSFCEVIMVHVELNISKEETEEIISILSDCISDLKMEISDTDTMDFRIRLKSKKMLIQKFIESLKNSQLPVAC